MDYGAIYTSMYWNLYYYDSSNHTYYYDGTNLSNHAVAIVGWNDDKFVPEAPGNGAWLVRNSWGTDWGNGGYFYISYYDSKIGKDNAAFINAEEPDNNELYEYDPLGWTSDWGYSSTTAWAANVFTANSGGSLDSVSTYAADVNTSYEIYVRDGLGGTTLETKSGTFNYPGYHTVDLSSPVSVQAGETFAIVIKYQTPDYNYPIPTECRISGYSEGATAGSGQSYISFDGTSWQDITTVSGGSTCNVNIKAIISTSSLEAPTSLTASSTSSSSIDLSWQDNSTSETGFRVYRDATLIDSVGANVTGYSDEGLSEGREYCYRVSAYNSSDESTKSNQACASTSGGTGLTMSFSSGNWHLMSIPLSPDPADCSSVLGDDLPPGYTCQGLIWGPWDGSSYGHPANVSPFEGYWLYASSQINADVEGTVPNSKEVTLNHTGWHMIGTPVQMDWGDVQIKVSGGTYQSISDIDFTCACSGAPLLNAIFEYDPSVGVYLANSQPGWDTYTLDRWTGYWVMVREGATLPVYLKFEGPTPGPPPPPSTDNDQHGVRLNQLAGNLPTPPPHPTEQTAKGSLKVVARPNFTGVNSEIIFRITGEKAFSVEGLRIAVTNLSGQKIFGESNEGSTLTWNTENVANGIYLYSAEINKGEGYESAGVGKLLVIN